MPIDHEFDGPEEVPELEDLGTEGGAAHGQELKVGEKIKLLRKERGLTLQDVAERTGFSPAVLSQMENHLISPPLGALVKLAQALDAKIGIFFGEGGGERLGIVRKDERKIVSRFASKEGVNYGYSYESLGFPIAGRHMEPFIVRLTPATIEAGELSAHQGEEFIFILEGEIEVFLGDHKDLLGPGDSIYYESTIPHRVASHGAREAKILAVLYAG